MEKIEDKIKFGGRDLTRTGQNSRRAKGKTYVMYYIPDDKAIEAIFELEVESGKLMRIR